MSYLINQIYVETSLGGIRLDDNFKAAFHCINHNQNHTGKWKLRDGSFVVKFEENGKKIEIPVDRIVLDDIPRTRINVDGTSPSGEKFKYGFDPMFKLFYISRMENETFERPEDLFPKYVDIPIGATGPPGPVEKRPPCPLWNTQDLYENFKKKFLLKTSYYRDGKTYLHPLRYNFICDRCNARYKDPDIRPFMEGMEEPEMKCKKCDQLHRFIFDSRCLPNGAYLRLHSDANEQLGGNWDTSVLIPINNRKNPSYVKIIEKE